MANATMTSYLSLAAAKAAIDATDDTKIIAVFVYRGVIVVVTKA
jgi:hypothetical protein